MAREDCDPRCPSGSRDGRQIDPETSGKRWDGTWYRKTLPPTSSLGESQTQPCLKKRRGSADGKPGEDLLLGHLHHVLCPPHLHLCDPRLSFCTVCSSFNTIGVSIHSLCGICWKRKPCKMLLPPYILASRKPGQVKMFVWSKSACRQSHSSERLNVET